MAMQSLAEEDADLRAEREQQRAERAWPHSSEPWGLSRSPKQRRLEATPPVVLAPPGADYLLYVLLVLCMGRA